MKNTLLVLASGVFALILAESLLSVAYRVRQGTWSRTPQKSYRQSLVAEEDYRLGPGATTFELHPLWGFSYNSRSPGVNAFGFYTPYAFEMGESGYRLSGESQKKRVVGIFGGSVADQTARLAGRYLEEKLDALVVNFAIGGHSLPQALHIFLYFKEMVDVAVFIDGLNELWNAADNNSYGTPPEYAKAAHFLFRAQVADLSVQNLIRMGSVLGRRVSLAHATRVSLWPFLGDSLVVHTAWRALDRVFKSTIAVQNRRIAASFETAPFFAVSTQNILSFAAARWESHHRLLHEIATAHGVADLHFLQPSPFAGHKVLTAEESNAIEKMPSLRRYVEDGFPLLQRAFERLQRNGVRGKNLVPLFDDVTDTRWKDGAHYNQAGAVEVADEIVRQVSWQRVRDVKGPRASSVTESGIAP